MPNQERQSSALSALLERCAQISICVVWGLITPQNIRYPSEYLTLSSRDGQFLSDWTCTAIPRFMILQSVLTVLTPEKMDSAISFILR